MLDDSIVQDFPSLYSLPVSSLKFQVSLDTWYALGPKHAREAKVLPVQLLDSWPSHQFRCGEALHKCAAKSQSSVMFLSRLGRTH